MTGRSAKQSVQAQPSELESEVLRLIWENGASTAEQVREWLWKTRQLKDSTVRTVLRRLSEKGFLDHTLEGRTYVYTARVGPGTAAAQAVKRIVDRFYAGSVEQLLVGLVDSEVVGEKELKSIAEKIEAARRSRK